VGFGCPIRANCLIGLYLGPGLELFLRGTNTAVAPNYRGKDKNNISNSLFWNIIISSE